MPVSNSVRDRLRKICGDRNVISEPHDLAIFERDGSIAGARPDVVVLAGSREEVQAVLAVASAEGLPVVPRGAGTGLSGGAVTIRGGVALSLARMRRIIELDPQARTAWVEPGVVNAELTRVAGAHGLYFAPDPSSQKACTIGGNAANNSGGPHCLYHGVTTNHVLGMEVVTADGRVHRLGGAAPDVPGLDLTGLMVGSEGTLCVITAIHVRLLPRPPSTATLLAAFPTVGEASQAVSAVIAAGILPSALEMMDRVTVGAVEAHYRAGYPVDAGAVLLAEVEGLQATCEEEIEDVRRLLEGSGAYALRLAATEPERALLWAGRKGAIGALGRIRPNYYLHDGVVPRTQLPHVLAEVERIAADHGLPVANVFHAGDGNLHPNILFDLRDASIMPRVEEAGEAMLRACIDAGGTLSGEHGIGLEKSAFMPWIFAPADLDAMRAVKNALDPGARLNPGKIFPDPEEPGSVATPRLMARSGLAAEASWW